MIAIPFLIQTPGWVQYGPALALLAGRNRSRPILWVTAGATVSVIGNWLGRLAAARIGNNHFVGDVDLALVFSFYFIALTEWQVTALERLVFRIAVFVLLVTYVALIAWIEDVTTLTRFAGMMYSIALMAAATWTLLRRAFAAFHKPLQKTDWFWVVGGLALYGAVTAMAQPIGKILLDTRRIDLFTQVWTARAIGIDLAFVLIITGFLIPPEPETAPL